MMHVHVLQHVPFEGLGSIESWLSQKGAHVTYTRFFEPTLLPALADIDFVIVMGGSMSVNDEKQLPWLREEKRFIAEAIALGKAVLGICLGAQLIANAQGARVYPGPEKESGWFPVLAESTASGTFVFPASTEVFHWHGETFDLPVGAVRLAHSAACRNQAFQIGVRVIGLQFHLETTTQSAEAIKTESGEGHICAIFEKAGPPNDKSLSCDLTLGRQWQEIFLPFKAQGTYDVGKASSGFHLGLQEQTVEIADFELFSFGKDFNSQRLPRTRIAYAGQAPDAPWRAEAVARIEKIRKADFVVAVTDATGKPLSGAKVNFAMKRHAFGWGSAVTVKNILRQDSDGEKYRAVIEKEFTRVVFESELKWHSWDNPANHENILKATDWLRTRNIEVRGHNLVWPSWINVPRDLRQLKDNPEALRQRINSHIASEVSAMKGRLVDWDVINEPYSNHDVMDLLGNGEMIAWFRLARSLDLDVRLTLNDYAILSASGLDKAHQDHFEKTLRFLKDGGAPITGLGMQSHFGGTPTSPERMLAILDRFAALGLDISVTEHDIDTSDEQLQADFTRDFLTTVFSHSSVVAVLTWGFWEGSHWRPNGAYYRQDWSVKPAGQVWHDLVLKKWWTNTTLETAADGTTRTRGYLGDYDVTVSYNGVSKTVSAKLTKTGAKVVIAL